MSARVFSSIPKQFARAARLRFANSPQMSRRMWKQAETQMSFLKQINKPVVPKSRSFSEMMERFRVTEMKRIQLGSLYMFSYVSKEMLEVLEHCQELLEEEESSEEDGLSTVTTTQGTT
ncbi:uncharacterized protein [Blastocystis hominis]|uniref:Uncharacterized protein n=1 Tax=Blastocystis hominis TaxID=12968 RepID=D8M8W8_BLAHO|nr:uncharacterized protein [Blastocystis hominis]CBK24507.2 unnamed protein product [Blastocystis hominis]|eukprot:XP_012898555.1 uncharacterized protein [Blastocystis hominis]